MLAYTGEILGGVAGAILLLLTAIAGVLYRNWRYEQELDSLLWKVNYKEIQIREEKDESSAPSGGTDAAKNNKVREFLSLGINTKSFLIIRREFFCRRGRKKKVSFNHEFLLSFSRVNQSWERAKCLWAPTQTLIFVTLQFSLRSVSTRGGYTLLKKSEKNPSRSREKWRRS